MGWEHDYRPQKFDEVIGQPYAVKLLSRLVQSGTYGRHLLLHGAVGSGKTTLLRLFARALNCESVDPTGSPCGECAMCRCPSSEYLLELDVPGRYRTTDKIRPLIELHGRPAPTPRVKMFFFDEAHHLAPDAQDDLLKAIEDAPVGIIFCFATTEADRIRPALRSRLWQIPIRPLTAKDAVELLEMIARREGLTYDRAALFLVAAVRPPFARDLVSALEELHTLGNPIIDSNLVREHFNFDAYEFLARYCVSLARGDRDAQTQIVADWRLPIAEQIQLLLQFLTTTYYHEIRGQKVCFDPVAESLTAERETMVQLLQQRLGAGTPQHLAPHFRAMLEFWANVTFENESILRLKLALFETYVNDELSRLVSQIPQVSSLRHSALVNNTSSDWETLGGLPTTRYLETEHVASVVSRASFLIQHYNRYLNTVFDADLSFEGDNREQRAFGVLDAICKDLYSSLPPPGALIATLERDEEKIRGRIAAHVPDIREAHIAMDLASLCQRWRENIGKAFLQVPLKAQSASKGHWEAALGLLRGYTPLNGQTDVLKLLMPKFPSGRHANPLDVPRIILSPNLSAGAIAAVSENFLVPLSAYDAGQWKWVTNNWEAKEFKDRCDDISERRDRVAKLQHQWCNDPVKLEEELARLNQFWRSMGPEGRKRTWIGWW